MELEVLIAQTNNKRKNITFLRGCQYCIIMHISGFQLVLNFLKESISYLIELPRSFQTFTPLYVNYLYDDQLLNGISECLTDCISLFCHSVIQGLNVFKS